MGEFKGKRILIAGLGISGKAAFEALLKNGARPAVYDNRDVEKEEPELFEMLRKAAAGCYLNGATPEQGWDYVVMSPGVPLWLPFVVNAQAGGACVIGELELAFRLGRGVFAAITGTNGKTTTTTLTGKILADAGLKAAVCGNIGNAVVTEAIEAEDDTWLVTEVSSFQLETTGRFRPKVAAFLNLTPDHMDRHKTMENYAAAKAKIFENQDVGDILVYNADDPLVSALAENACSKKLPFSRVRELERGAFVHGGSIVFADGGSAAPVIRTDEIRIPGLHNLENALAATAVAMAAGVECHSVAGTLRDFKGVEHRLEFVAAVNGVAFINDSKGTNPDAAIKAIEAVGKKDNILLIAGGYDKEADFTDYIRAAGGKAKKLLLLGATAGKLKDCALAEGFAKNDVITVSCLEEAVRLGFGHAAPGDIVLLSPACASWDMYKNYEERGAHFKKAVKMLEADAGGCEMTPEAGE